MKGEVRYSRDKKELVVIPVTGGAYPLYKQNEDKYTDGIYIGKKAGLDFFVIWGEEGIELCETEHCIMKLSPSNKRVILAKTSNITLTESTRTLAKNVLDNLK